YALTLRRLRVPAPADLLALCGGGDRALRSMGRWLDGAGAFAALSAVRNLGPRFRARTPVPAGALVSALALRTMAGHQCTARRRFLSLAAAPAPSFGGLPSLRRRLHIAPSRLPALVRRSEQKEMTMADHPAASSPQASVQSDKVSVTFPDGARREYPSHTTGLDIAK